MSPGLAVRRRFAGTLDAGLTALCGGTLAVTLLLVLGMLALLGYEGLSYGWQQPVVELKLASGATLVGEVSRRETAESGGRTVHRTLYRTGNRDLADADFTWVDDAAVVATATPPELVVVEREEWGNFYGRLVALRRGAQPVAEGESAAWTAFAAGHPGADTAVLRDAAGRTKDLPLAAIVRVVRPNTLGTTGRIGLYLARGWEFLSANPRESNTEGGIFPALFGTVLMVFLMTAFVTPVAVLAAVYLREYARQGALVRAVRIAVNNLAGVPSIVFGVFGLGFFVYIAGGSIDRLFFASSLPTPTFGTGGILWAAATLALLTAPVVIVAAEEGLAAVPRAAREGSLALGATKWETTTRVVLPAAAPGILTGVILAMARAAGEVAPLMIVGMVKLAPNLPVDGHVPFLHLERKFMHLGFHIYDAAFQSPNVEASRPMVYASALLLVVVVTAMNLSAIALRNHLRRKYATSAV